MLRFVYVLPLGLIALMGSSAPVRADLANNSLKKPLTVMVSEKRLHRFQNFVNDLWPMAKSRGVSRATFDLAFADIAPDPQVIELTQKQAEFQKPIWAYVEGAVTANRLERGGRLAALESNALDEIEAKYGVDKSVLVGIWGVETNFGSATGGKDVIRALATLAFAKYRGEFFRDQLLTALQILEEGHIARENFKGSWAGAMGQTQFMPSSFKAYAVDFSGDGKKDVWTTPEDALASSANYLKEHGWVAGLPWGFEVILPKGFDFKLHQASFSEWQSKDVVRADSKSMPTSGEATLFLPAGAEGPALLITSNFNVIKKYNASDSYALSVAYLGDRVLGAPAFTGRWPKTDLAFGLPQKKELQRRLKRLGFYDGDIDGLIGSRTRAAIRAFQLKSGLIPDGFAGPRVLAALQDAKPVKAPKGATPQQN